MKLKVPHYRQEKDYTCGQASLQMALSFFGNFKTQKQIFKLLDTSEAQMNKEGVSNHKMVAAALKSGFYCYINDNSTIEEVKYYVNSGFPVIVNYIDLKDKDKEGHFAVVSGYSNVFKTIIINDPDRAVKFRIFEKDFVKCWHSRYERHNHWMMVLSKNPFKLGRQFTPKIKNKLK